MRRITVLCSAALFIACAKTENPPADTGMAVAPAAPEAAAAAPISLNDVAGNYAVTGKYEGEDTAVVRYDLTATADTSGWTIAFPNRKPIPIRIISVSGDSIVGEAGPYPSAIRSGVQVRTSTVYRLQNGKLMGRTLARYETKGEDTVRIVLSEAIRK